MRCFTFWWIKLGEIDTNKRIGRKPAEAILSHDRKYLESLERKSTAPKAPVFRAKIALKCSDENLRGAAFLDQHPGSASKPSVRTRHADREAATGDLRPVTNLRGAYGYHVSRSYL